MGKRFLIAAAAVCLALAGFGWYFYLPHSPAAERASALMGERWYRLTLDDQHLGYWHTNTSRDYLGRWIFESEQRFAMSPGDPVSTTTRRVFGGRPPYELEIAEYRQKRREWSEALRVERTDSGYQSSRTSAEDPDRSASGWSREARLDWQNYALEDYLGFEVWLHTLAPTAGASRTVPVIDFERSAVVNRTFDVVSREPQGYVIENAAPYSATRLQLDERYAPIEINIAGLFDLTLSSREQALAPRSALQFASYFVPADRRLSNHTGISRLVLAVEGHQAPVNFFGGLRQSEGRWLLTLEANPLSQSGRGNTSSESLRFPASHPQIISLLEPVIANHSDDLAKAHAITAFVHDYLTYRPGAAPRPVLALLDKPQGDCTEFADLTTTLARSAGLSARTVFGLAYSDQSEPSFAFHAWNEIRIDGDWIAMDPTWNQTRVDATHIPLPQDDSAALQMLTGAVDLAFSVLEIEYFQSP